MPLSDTIVALATNIEASAIAVIRISGANAFDIVSKYILNLDDKIKSQKRLFVAEYIVEGMVIDQLVCSIFFAPNSFTGENIVELTPHASHYVVNEILKSLTLSGARIAGKGEFTQRAFLNNKLDLSQAEAIADLISAESKSQHSIAINQMKGGISNELNQLRLKIIDVVSLLELELDFGEEDVEFIDLDTLLEMLKELDSKIDNMIDSFTYGNAIKNGINIAIIGAPNAGKSTLLNTIAQEERAIVSDIEGTTRDFIEEIFYYNGIKLRFVDTAGLRKTNDEIEKIGVKKAYEKANESQIIIYLFDKNNFNENEVFSNIKSIKSNDNDILLVQNKIDITQWEDNDNFAINVKNSLNDYIYKFIGIEAKNKSSLTELFDEINELIINKYNNHNNNLIITNQRHFDALNNVKKFLNHSIQGIEKKISTDLIALDLKYAMQYMGSITGVIDIDKDILSNIFSRFCIGK